MPWTISASGDKESVETSVKNQADAIATREPAAGLQVKSFADHVASTIGDLPAGVQASISASGHMAPDGTGYESVSMTFSKPMAGGTG